MSVQVTREVETSGEWKKNRVQVLVALDAIGAASGDAETDRTAIAKFTVSDKDKPSVDQTVAVRGDITLTVLTLTEMAFRIKTTTNSTVHDVKVSIQKTEGIPANLVRLIYVGKELRDEKKLWQEHVEDGAKLYLIRRLSRKTKAARDEGYGCGDDIEGSL